MARVELTVVAVRADQLIGNLNDGSAPVLASKMQVTDKAAGPVCHHPLLDGKRAAALATMAMFLDLDDVS